MRHILVLGLAALLPACQTFSPDGGMSVVADVTSQTLKKNVALLRTPEDTALVTAKVKGLLKRRLTADAAVQVALLNNRGLQAAYNELGLAEAAMVQGSLPPNPTFSVERLSGPAEIEIEKRIVANILALATLPARADIAAGRFLQAQLAASEQTLRVAAETRRAYYRAVAAQEQVGLLDQAKSAAETAATLAKRLGETGALNKLDQAREQVFYAEVTAQLASARQRAASERERLIRSMGLWGADLVSRSRTRCRRCRRVSARCRLSKLMRCGAGSICRSRGSNCNCSPRPTGSPRRRVSSTCSRSPASRRPRASGQSGEVRRERGFELEFQIPIFDLGEVRVRQAEQSYMQAFNRLTEKAVNVRSEARDAYRSYRSTYDIAAHYRREVLPLRQIISDEMLLRYNAMQIDVFALLIEARQRLDASIAAIEAQREFWLASVDLTTAVTGGGVAGGGDGVRTTPRHADRRSRSLTSTRR